MLLQGLIACLLGVVGRNHVDNPIQLLDPCLYVFAE